MDDPHQTLDDALIARYVAGLCTPDEQQWVQARIATNPSDAEAVRHAARIWALHEQAPLPFHKQALWGRIARDARRQSTGIQPTLRSVLSRVPIVAAAVIVVAGTTLWMERTRFFGASDAQASIYKTARGQQIDVTLPDGSKATLAPETTVRFATTDSGRSVSLNGEAYFDVVHDPAHPFVVRTASVVVRDVGTTFVVRAYTDVPVQVGVQTGRVSLRASVAPTPMLLTAGSMAQVDTTITVRRQVNLDELFAWRQGVLRFDDASVAAICATIARRYGIDVRVTDRALGAERLALTLHDQDSARALTVVSRLANAKLVWRGRVALLVAPAHSSHH